MASVYQLLRPLEKVESSMASIYQALAERFAADPEAARLFGRLAMDERSHATQIQYARRIAGQNEGAFASIDLDPSEALRTLGDLDTLQRAVAAVPLDEAVRLLLAFELSAAEAHGRPALADAAGSLRDLLTGLMRADEDHSRSLRAFAVARGFIDR